MFHSTYSEKVIFGNMFNSQKQDLTENHQKELVSQFLDDIPLDLAIKIGVGLVRIIEFVDPNHPICGEMKKNYLIDKRISRYICSYPLKSVHAESENESLSSLCSDSTTLHYQETMLGLHVDKDLLDNCRSCSIELPSKHISSVKINRPTINTFDVISKTFFQEYNDIKLEELIKTEFAKNNINRTSEQNIGELSWKRSISPKWKTYQGLYQMAR